MSSVFRGVHTETGVEVAVKILPRTLANNWTLLQRFQREARGVEALEHPNIVANYDRGLDDVRHYLVLEYLGGGELNDIVRLNGPLAVAEAVAVIRSVFEGLNFAALRGLIPRGLLPMDGR